MESLRRIMSVLAIASLLLSGAAFAEEEGEKKAEEKAVSTESVPPQGLQIKEDKNVDDIQGIQTRFFVKGDIEAVWKYIGDVTHLGKLFPAVKKVTKKSEVDANTIIWEYELDTSMGTKKLDVKRSVNEKNHSVKWSRVEGDFRYYGGSWALKASEKYPGWVECRYANYIDAGALVPYFVVKGNSKKNAEAMVPALRKLVAEEKE